MSLVELITAVSLLASALLPWLKYFDERNNKK